MKATNFPTPLTPVKDIAPPANARLPKPAPPANVSGPLKPGTDPASSNMVPPRKVK
jgi:hypothetical protein